MLELFLRILVVAAFVGFCAVILIQLARKYLGHNPNAPSAWSRFRSWWHGFVKQHICDVDPFDELPTPRYLDYVDWPKVPKDYNWSTVCLGEVHFWKHEPSLFSGDTMFNSARELFKFPRELNCESAIIGPLPLWRESLRKRPGK